MGMAAIGISLWKYVMKYSPKNPSFFNRDRFVLSNGRSAASNLYVIELIMLRTHLPFSIQLYASGRVQKHDNGTTTIISL
jgi:dihydroxyacetone synthase